MSLTIYLIEKENGCEPNEVFSINITHNLNTMANEVGIYNVMWRPDEIGITLAKDAIPILGEGIKQLESAPDYYKKFNPTNNWGSYNVLVDTVRNYLIACCKYPDATIETYG